MFQPAIKKSVYDAMLITPKKKKKKLFAGDFCANLDEKNAGIVQFTKIWN